MSLHAFVDESARKNQYLLCAVTIDPAHLKHVRKELLKLLLSGQRELHFHKEKSHRKRLITGRIAQLQINAMIYRATFTAKTQEAARQSCLSRCVRDLLEQRVQRLVIDSRNHRDVQDEATIYRHLGRRPSLSSMTYEHTESNSTPGLWLPDAIAWCYGANSHWRQRIDCLVTRVTDL